MYLCRRLFDGGGVTLPESRPGSIKTFIYSPVTILLLSRVFVNVYTVSLNSSRSFSSALFSIRLTYERLMPHISAVSFWVLGAFPSSP